MADRVPTAASCSRHTGNAVGVSESQGVANLLGTPLFALAGSALFLRLCLLGKGSAEGRRRPELKRMVLGGQGYGSWGCFEPSESRVCFVASGVATALGT